MNRIHKSLSLLYKHIYNFNEIGLQNEYSNIPSINLESYESWKSFTSQNENKEALLFMLPSFHLELLHNLYGHIPKDIIYYIVNQFTLSNTVKDILESDFSSIESMLVLEGGHKDKNYNISLFVDVIKELLNITNQFQEYQKQETLITNRIILYNGSNLFLNEILLDYITIMLPIAITHLPHIFPLEDTIKALIHQPYGLSFIISIILNGYSINPLQIVEYLIQYAKSISLPSTYQENYNLPKEFLFTKSDSLLFRIKMIIYYLCDIYGCAGKAIDLRNLLYNSYIFPEIQSYLTRNYICDPMVFFNQINSTSQNIYLWNQFFLSRNHNSSSECKELMIYILEYSLRILDSSNDINQLKLVVTMINNITESFNAQFTSDELKLIETIKKRLSDFEQQSNYISNKKIGTKTLSDSSVISDHSKWISELFHRLYEPILQYNSIKPQSQVKQLVKEWEDKYIQSDFEQFMTSTVNAMIECNEKKLYTHEDLIEDPLLLFKFNGLILSYPIVFKSIFLKSLQYFMNGSINWIKVKGESKNISKESIDDIILLQESSIIQALLSLMIFPDLLTLDTGIIESIRVIICNFLHEIFIEKPILIKLVHQQGYHPDILPIVCQGVQSIHYCLELLPELYHTNNLDKYIFYVKLTSHLSKIYPIQRSLELCDNIMRTYYKDKGISYQVWIETLTDLCRIVEAFPVLLDLFISIFYKFERFEGIKSKEKIIVNGKSICIGEIIEHILSRVIDLNYTKNYV